MVTTHSERYGQDYWAAFDADVAPHLPASPVVIDVGCGPGLFLRDLARRDPSASLYGYDVTPAMIEYAQGLAWPGVTPTLVVHDVATAPLPHAAGTVDLVSMTSVLHVLDEPLPVLAEIRRVLPRGASSCSTTGRVSRSRAISPGAGTGSARPGPSTWGGPSVSSPCTTSTRARTGSGCWPRPASPSATRRRSANRTGCSSPPPPRRGDATREVPMAHCIVSARIASENAGTSTGLP